MDNTKKATQAIISMNAISSTAEFKRLNWQTAIILTLGFWLSASFILDWVIMPSLYVSGMMNQAGFTTAGYVVFWNFNRLELLAAAVVLTGVLALSKSRSDWGTNAIILSATLLTVSLLDTYLFTPQMCAVSIQLNLFEAATLPASMTLLHGGYWLLEVVKLLAGGVLFTWCWQQS